MIEIRSLCKDYYVDKKPFPVLKNISLSFPVQQFVSILGPSGCGKTTLLNLIGGLDSFSGGDIIVNDRSLKKMKPAEMDSYRNNEIGFVFQQYYLMPQLTVLQNVTIGLEVRDYKKDEIQAKAMEALKKVGLASLAKKKPNQLSGGQAQRVAIARAIVTDPSVILADEPTGALDSETSVEIMLLLKDISKHCLVIMVTHNEELAKKYSDRLIRLKDGKVVSDVALTVNQTPVALEEKQMHRSHLSFLSTTKLAGLNLLSKKWKTILTSVANSFGVIGIAFFLAINYGFNNYSTRLSSQSASSLPIVVTAYNESTSKSSYGDSNSDTLYPSTDEIYPSVTVTSQKTYTYNNFSAKYFNYLDSLEDQGIVREYLTTYGNSYSFNLMTQFPQSLDSTSSSYYSTVNTSITNYNYYASQSGLPYNIFHVLYGDLDSYDLLDGSLPTNENELVLVVDKYNSVSFTILKNLGFYNSTDTEDEVKDTSLATKVKPIKFSDIVGKEYKIFSNDDYYTQVVDDNNIVDAYGNSRNVTYYQSPTSKEDLYKDTTKGTSLKISGIIRAKSTNSLVLLSPSLCYLPSLQATMIPKETDSEISSTAKNNVVFINPNSSLDPLGDFTSSLKTIVDDYKTASSDTSASTYLPITDINTLVNKYFRCYSLFSSGYYYTQFNYYLSNCEQHGVELVPDEYKTMDFTDADTIESLITEISNLKTVSSAYTSLVGLVAYINAFSVVQEVVIFPTDLTQRSILLTKLDEFNNLSSTTDSSVHATSKNEQVYYAKENTNYMIEDVGEMISLVSMILIIFAIVSFIVSCSMTALMTSNNVLERKREIGLLRSLGTRKLDIALLFESESLYVGTFSGLMGSLLTYILCFPINYL
ncbi:MAG: ABC transporter ATP-binding protein/permease, partial [Bacilli bacterium]